VIAVIGLTAVVSLTVLLRFAEVRSDIPDLAVSDMLDCILQLLIHI
jgi:hypothetical protein